MLPEISYISKGHFALKMMTNIWLLLGMTHEMGKQLAYADLHLAAGASMVAFKQSGSLLWFTFYKFKYSEISGFRNKLGQSVCLEYMLHEILSIILDCLPFTLKPMRFNELLAEYIFANADFFYSWLRLWGWTC